MESLEDMSVRLFGDGRTYENMVASAIGSTRKLTHHITDSVGQIEGITRTLEGFGETVQGIVGMLASGLGISTFISTIQSAISKAAEQEQIEIAFRSLIGNAEEATTAIKGLQEFAVKTPFELPGILAAAKMMLAYGEDAESIIPTMQKLGDVASGLNIPLGSLTYLYGTLKSSGRVMTVDMRQFANRGIPIWLELAKAIGMVSMDTRKLTSAQSAQLQQMTTKGQVTFQMIEKAFTNMTSKGGRFFHMMEDQSASFNGIVSNLKDSLGLLLADVGAQIIEGLDLKRVVKEIGAIAQAFADWFKHMDPGMKRAIFTVGAVVLGMGLLIAAALTVKAVIAGLVSIVAALGWPFLVLAGLVIAAIAVWVTSVGGVGKALDIVKKKLEEAWEWLQPIKQALVEFGSALRDSFLRTFSLIQTVATEAFRSIAGDGELSLGNIKENITLMILHAEYEMLRFEKSYQRLFEGIGAEIGWATAKLLFLVKVQLRILELMAEIEARSGQAAWGRGMGKGNKPLDPKLLELPDTFEEFKKQRDAMHAEMEKNKPKADALVPKKDDMKKAGEEAGAAAGKAMGKAMKKEVQLLDSVLFGSADHVRRIDAYMKDAGLVAAGPDGAGAVGAGLVKNNPNKGVINELVKQTKILDGMPMRTASDICECFCKCLGENLKKQTEELGGDVPLQKDPGGGGPEKPGGMRNILKAFLPYFPADVPPEWTTDDPFPKKTPVPVERPPMTDDPYPSKVPDLLEDIIEAIEGGSKGKRPIEVEGAKVALDY